MAEFMFLMHADQGRGQEQDQHQRVSNADWGPYLDWLGSEGALRGGSALGDGVCVRRSGEAPAITRHVVGYVKVEAPDLEGARKLLKGNPVYEAGGVVEIRELPRS